MHTLDDWFDAAEGSVRTESAFSLARRLARLLRPHRRGIALGLVLLLLSVLADLAAPLVLRTLVDDAIPARSAGKIVGSAAAILVLFLAARIAGYAQITVLARTGLAVVSALKLATFRHILELSLDFFDRNAPGRLMARVESDTERLLALFSETGAAIAATSLLFVGTIAFMFAVDVRVAATVVCLMIPIVVANVFYLRYLRGFYGATRKTYSSLTAFLAEYVQAVPLIQVMGLEERARARLEERNRARVRAEIHSTFREYPWWGLLQAAEVAMVMAILAIGLHVVLGAGMSVGTLILFVEYTRRLFQPIAQVSEQLNFVNRAFASAERVFAIHDTRTRTPEAPDARDEIPGDWRELRFEDVSFDYAAEDAELRGAAREPQRALERVSFSVRRGERVAIVGPSGGGKTTIASLILRFYDPSSGRVALDGADLRSFGKAAWRRHVGLVLQDVALFPGTVEENLRVFAPEGEGDAAAIRRVLEAIDAGELVARLPDGLATELAEGGANLSLGERQLLSFARALLRDPALLVLDEATSSVDPSTERRLERLLERLLSGRTAIIIAHRLETARRADRILVMHEGRLAEAGTHDDLTARGGIYRDLCTQQLRGAKRRDEEPASTGAGAAA